MKLQDIYLDYNATSPVRPEVLQAMLPYFSERFGNSVSVAHAFGWQAEKDLDTCRTQIAKSLNIKNPHDIFFTSGATESNNWVFWGLAEAMWSENKFHIITSSIEHASVLKSAQRLEKLNLADVTYLSPNSLGEITADSVLKAIRPTTKLVSLFWVQNEIGSINDIKNMAQICRLNKIYFHTDATQAIGKIPVDLTDVPVDLLSLSAHKFGGPKGVGILYKRSHDPVVNIHPMILGGGHEFGQRSGTVNLPLIIGLSKALELSTQPQYLQELKKHWQNLQNIFWNEIKNNFATAQINGPTDFATRSPNNLNITFNGYHVPVSMPGLATSRGSACMSGKWTASPTLNALQLNELQAQQTLRFSMGPETTPSDILQSIQILKKYILPVPNS